MLPVIGSTLIILGVVIAVWRLVDPASGEESFVVGWAVATCGLIVLAVWAGLLIGRRRPAIPRSADDENKSSQGRGAILLAVGFLFLAVGSLALSFRSFGGIWADIWTSRHPESYVFYSVFQYSPVVVTFGTVVEVVGLVLSFVGIRSLLVGARR